MMCRWNVYSRLRSALDKLPVRLTTLIIYLLLFLFFCPLLLSQAAQVHGTSSALEDQLPCPPQTLQGEVPGPPAQPLDDLCPLQEVSHWAGSGCVAQQSHWNRGSMQLTANNSNQARRVRRISTIKANNSHQLWPLWRFALLIPQKRWLWAVKIESLNKLWDKQVAKLT